MNQYKAPVVTANQHGLNSVCRTVSLIGDRSINKSMKQVEEEMEKVTKPPHLSFSQVQALLNAIRDDRERGLVYCLFGLGLRLSETRRLTPMDIMVKTRSAPSTAKKEKNQRPWHHR